MTGAFAVVGVFSLSFAAGALFGSAQSGPVLVTGTAGLVMVGLADWLAGLLGSETTVSG